jgi:hypothetical protein
LVEAMESEREMQVFAWEENANQVCLEDYRRISSDQCVEGATEVRQGA